MGSISTRIVCFGVRRVLVAPVSVSVFFVAVLVVINMRVVDARPEVTPFL
jgi:hypothetical protein